MPGNIILFRFGLNQEGEPQTLEQLGGRFGVTKERIRQLETRALEKLRKYLGLLAGSLSQKDPNVLSETVKTYRTFAEQKYCEPRSLISRDEQNQALAGVGIRP